jgi:hypothetical protein
MSHSRKIDSSGLWRAISHDDHKLLTSKDLREAIETGEQEVVSGDVESLSGNMSLFHYVLSNQCLNLSDYILLQDDDQFRPGRTPCFAGHYQNNRASRNNLLTLSSSPQQMFHLAQTIYRYYSENDPSSTILDDLNKHQKTYLEAIYWTNSSEEKVYYDISSSPHKLFSDKTPDLLKYWDMAKKITDLQQFIADTPHVDDKKQATLCEIGDIYLALAFEENKIPHPHYWLINKAIDCYVSANATEKLALLTSYLGIRVTDGGTEEIRAAILGHFKNQTTSNQQDFLTRVAEASPNTDDSAHESDPETVYEEAATDRKLNTTPNGIEAQARFSDEDKPTNSGLRKLNKQPAAAASGKTTTNPMHDNPDDKAAKIYGDPTAIKQTFAGASSAADAKPAPSTPNVRPSGKEKFS